MPVLNIKSVFKITERLIKYIIPINAIHGNEYYMDKQHYQNYKILVAKIEIYLVIK